jgi:hypothetical protein
MNLDPGVRREVGLLVWRPVDNFAKDEDFPSQGSPSAARTQTKIRGTKSAFERSRAV